MLMQSCRLGINFQHPSPPAEKKKKPQRKAKLLSVNIFVTGIGSENAVMVKNNFCLEYLLEGFVAYKATVGA